MITSVEIKGLREASDNLTKELEKTGQLTQKFVILAAKSVEAATAPYVPVDTSLLINSAYTQVRQYKGSGSMPAYLAVFGYGANYAGYAHEGGPKNWQKAGASDEFLLRGVNDFIDETLDDLVEMLGG